MTNEQLREALAQQRKYERENWPFVDGENKPTGTGESITYHLASLYCWSPGYVLSLPAKERDERLQEIWRSFAIAGDIIKRYEDATVALLLKESEAEQEPVTPYKSQYTLKEVIVLPGDEEPTDR